MPRAPATRYAGPKPAILNQITPSSYQFADLIKAPLFDDVAPFPRPRDLDPSITYQRRGPLDGGRLDVVRPVEHGPDCAGCRAIHDRLRVVLRDKVGARRGPDFVVELDERKMGSGPPKSDPRICDPPNRVVLRADVCLPSPLLGGEPEVSTECPHVRALVLLALRRGLPLCPGPLPLDPAPFGVRPAMHYAVNVIHCRDVRREVDSIMRHVEREVAQRLMRGEPPPLLVRSEDVEHGRLLFTVTADERHGLAEARERGGTLARAEGYDVGRGVTYRELPAFDAYESPSRRMWGTAGPVGATFADDHRQRVAAILGPPHAIFKCEP